MNRRKPNGHTQALGCRKLCTKIFAEARPASLDNCGGMRFVTYVDAGAKKCVCVCNIWIDVKLLLLSFFSPSNKGCNLQCRGCQGCTLDWHQRRRQCVICDIDGDAHRRTCLFCDLLKWQGAKPRTPPSIFHVFTVTAIWTIFLVKSTCMFQDSVPAGSLNWSILI